MVPEMIGHMRQSQEDCVLISKDMVSHPSHYTTRSMEAIEIIETAIEDQNDPVIAYLMSNVIKYLLRFQHKGAPKQDLEKARWYLERMISKIN